MNLLIQWDLRVKVFIQVKNLLVSKWTHYLAHKKTKGLWFLCQTTMYSYIMANQTTYKRHSTCTWNVQPFSLPIIYNTLIVQSCLLMLDKPSLGNCWLKLYQKTLSLQLKENINSLCSIAFKQRVTNKNKIIKEMFIFPHQITNSPTHTRQQRLGRYHIIPSCWLWSSKILTLSCMA